MTEAFFDREGISYISIVPDLRNHRVPAGLYFPFDGHLTEAGVQVVAEAIAKELAAQGLLIPPAAE